MSGLTILLVGFFVGMKHAIESDHVAAVASLATRQTSMKATIRQGVAWGIGHTLTLVVLGGIVLWLGTEVPPGLDRSLELCVGAMLILLGFDVLRRMHREKIHFHVHSHADGATHVHAHSHSRARAAALLPNIVHLDDLPHLDLKLDHTFESHEHMHPTRLPLRGLAVGMMHGLAGTAALVLLSAQTTHSFSAGLAYILIFGAGSIAGMALLSLAIAIPLRMSGTYLTGAYRGLNATIGLLTMGLGLFVVYRIGIADGLLLG